MSPTDYCECLYEIALDAANWYETVNSNGQEMAHGFGSDAADEKLP